LEEEKKEEEENCHATMYVVLSVLEE